MKGAEEIYERILAQYGSEPQAADAKLRLAEVKVQAPKSQP
jgi:TolA-binding protein